jgi:broad specificity phosphatase PhoE
VGREIELRRHTDADGDVLTPEGVAAALKIGARLVGGYQLAISTGAQRATQTLACFLATLGQQVPGGVVVEPGLRSRVEDRWRTAPLTPSEVRYLQEKSPRVPGTAPFGGSHGLEKLSGRRFRIFVTTSPRVPAASRSGSANGDKRLCQLF